MDSTAEDFWRRCSSCKAPIGLGSRYYVCSVSTCNGQRTGFVFCTVPCFERHLPSARHKDAAAIEKTAPQTASPTESASEGRPPVRMMANATSTTKTSTAGGPPLPREVLVVASRLKDYIDARSGYNTSSGVMDVLSEHLRILCDRAIDNARAEGRKTVMDRDFDFLKK